MKQFRFIIAYLVCLAITLPLPAAQNVKTVNGVPIANVNTVKGVAIANVKTFGGVDNTGSSFLVNQDFEGVGTPSGWTGTANFDSLVSPPEGVQCADFTGTQTASISDGGALNNGDLYFKFILRVGTLPASGIELFYALNTGGTRMIRVTLLSGGTIRVTDRTGEVFATTTDAVSTGTNYYVLVHNLKGTGLNQVCSVEFNTTDSFSGSGNKFAGGNTGHETDNITNCTWECGDSSAFKIDVVKIAASAF